MASERHRVSASSLCSPRWLSDGWEGSRVIGTSGSEPLGEPSQPPQSSSLHRLLQACDSRAARDRGAGGSFELRGSGLPARRGAGAQVSEGVGWDSENPRTLSARKLGSRGELPGRRGEKGQSQEQPIGGEMRRLSGGVAQVAR